MSASTRARILRAARLPAALLTAALIAVALAACGGGGSGDATALLRQTFSGPHTVNSGNITLSLTVNPSGSTTLRTPITLSFEGPFQSRGKGNLPASDFNLSVSALGHTGSLAILSTGTAGYVTVSGISYQLPSASFQRLESSFSQLGASPGAGAGAGTLSKLGIDPLHWLVNPSVVGTESVGGAQTKHIRADVDVQALLGDLNTFLQRAASLGVSGASKLPVSISQSTRQQIAAEVKNPTFDLWTGAGDKTVRKVAISLTVPVSGQISSLLGGLSSAGIGLNLQYADLNQPQTIVAPTVVHPYSEFAAKVRAFASQLQSTLGAVGLGSSATGSGASSSSATGTATTGTGSSTPAGVQAYSQCIQAAGGDVAKMQRCASLLNSK